jgi:hypothetical protein
MSDLDAAFSSNRTPVLIVVLVAMIAVLALAGPAAAEPSTVPQQTTSNTTTTNNSTGGSGYQPPRFIGGGEFTPGANQTTAITTNNSSSGGIVPNFGNPLNPVEQFKKLVSGFFKVPATKFINAVNNRVFGVPAPGEPLQPASWSNPNDGKWKGVVKFTGFSTVLATLFLIFSGGRTFMESDEYARRSAWKRWVTAVLMILTTWTLVPLGLHIADAIATGLAVDGKAMLESWATMGKVGTGIGFTLILGLLQPTIVAAGMFALALERFLIFVGVGLWPLAWSLRSMKSPFAQSIGQTFIYIFGVTIVAKLGQALIGRFLFSLQFESFGSSLMTFIMIGVGVVFMLVYFPMKMLQHANDAASVSLGVGGPSRRQVGQYADRANERVGQIHDKVETYRADGGDSPRDTDRYESHADSGTRSGSRSDNDPIRSPLTSMTDYDTSVDDRAIPDDLEEQVARIERTETMSQRLSDDD